MIFGSIKPGRYTGIVKARSSGTPGRDHTYTVAIQIPGGSEVEFQGVSPYPAKRLTRQDPTLELIPFEIDEPVDIHLMGSSDDLRVIIGEAEQPYLGPCTQGSP